MGQGALKERSFTFCNITTFTQGDKKKKRYADTKSKVRLSFFVLCGVVIDLSIKMFFCVI